MATTNGPNLKALVNAAIGDPIYSPLMTQWRTLDFLVQLVVISRVISVPPVSPANGDIYIMPASPTGTWAGRPVGTLARWSGALWEYTTPENGWKCYVTAESSRYRFKGGLWAKVVSAGARSVATVTASTLMTTSQAGQYTRVASASETVMTFAGVAVGAMFFFRQVGTGQVSFGTATYAKTRKQHSTACVIVTQSGIDVMGDLEVVP